MAAGADAADTDAAAGAGAAGGGEPVGGVECGPSTAAGAAGAVSQGELMLLLWALSEVQQVGWAAGARKLGCDGKQWPAAHGSGRLRTASEVTQSLRYPSPPLLPACSPRPQMCVPAASSLPTYSQPGSKSLR